MADRNAYFKIIDGDTTVSLRYYPPEGKGEKLKIDEVTNFLSKVGIKDFELVKVNALITSDKEIEGVISNNGCYKFDEVMDLKITPDKMLVVAVFYPNSENGSRLTKDDIISHLMYNKIKFGIIDSAIEAFVENPEYCKGIVVAKGEKPIDGKDAYITYNFQTDRTIKPQLKEDGTVDFHNLNTISNIKTGDVLAVLTKEEPGTPGTDVFGAVALPRKVNKLTLKHGNGARVSEDGLQLISEVDGHAILEGDKVFVSDNYDVPADVDNSTGDINYNGSVTIKGNVRTGFAVKSDRNIEIFGVVEGATVIAGGDIILHRGIQGMGKSHIEAKGNLISKFIESADIKVDGYVETDTILNSNVSARSDIFVRGKNASIIGGNVRSTSLIEAAIIGSPMGTATSVEVGIDPSLRDRVKQLKDTITNKTKENEKLNQILTVMRKKKDMGALPDEQMPMLSQLTKSVILNSSDIKKAEAELAEAEAEISENANAKIRIKKSIYPGTKVSISGDYIFVHDEIIHSEFIKDRGEIKPVSY